MKFLICLELIILLEVIINDYLELRINEINDINSLGKKNSNIDKQSTQLYSETESYYILIKDKNKLVDKSLNCSTNPFFLNIQHIDSSNILSNDNNNYLPKSFIETFLPNKNEIFNEHVYLSYDQSASFIVNSQKYRNNFKNEYISNYKNTRTSHIAERESKAEESNYLNMTKDLMNYNLTQQTMIFDSIDKDNNNNLELKNTKIIVKHSLKKNKSPRFLHPVKKLSNKRNIQVLGSSNNLQTVSLYNRDNISKYNYLFGDIENNRTNSVFGNKTITSKKYSNLDVIDFANLQKFGTHYSINKRPRSEIHSNLGLIDPKRNLDSISNREKNYELN